MSRKPCYVVKKAAAPLSFDWHETIVTELSSCTYTHPPYVHWRQTRFRRRKRWHEIELRQRDYCESSMTRRGVPPSVVVLCCQGLVA